MVKTVGKLRMDRCVSHPLCVFVEHSVCYFLNNFILLHVKPLSQLAHDHFKTLCDPAFWQSHDGSPTLHELSLPLHAIFQSPAVASDF